MASPGYTNGSLASSMTGLSADDFVAVLRLLGDANAREAVGRERSRSQRPATASAALPLGRCQMFLARLERIVQDAQEWISSISVFLCLGFLKLTLRIVIIGQNTIALCCGRRTNGQVNRLTSVHWSLTNMVIQLQGLRQEKTSRQRSVHDFLKKYQIALPLSTRVKKYVDRSQPSQIRDSDALALQKLSNNLVMDLHEEMRAPALSGHPFFVSLRTKHPTLVRELCQEALLPTLKLPDEIVFYAGDPCCHMYFVVSGSLQYTTTAQPRDADPRRPLEAASVRRMIINGSQWLSEAALWTSWVHRGELRVVGDSLLFALDASGFARVISSHNQAHVVAAAYARKFVETLNRGPQSDLTEPGPVDQ